MLFKDIPGHTRRKEQLRQAVQKQRLPHAQLFCGPAGSPTLTMALALATYLQCPHKSAEDVCGQCQSCSSMAKFTHPDVQFIFPTAPTTKFTGKEVISRNFLPAWRTFLKETSYGDSSDWSYAAGLENKQLSINREEARQISQHIHLKSFTGRHKIVLLWQPEYLHPTAANALLKILEEPPAHTLFLFVTLKPEKLLPTISSRVQSVSIRAFTDEEIMPILTQKSTLSEAALHPIVLLAEGNLQKALSLLDNTVDATFEQLKVWLRTCYAADLTALVAQAADFQQLKKEGQKNFLRYALHMIREVLVVTMASQKLARSSAAEQDFAQKLGQTFSAPQVKACADGLDQAYYHLERNANAKILYLDLSLKLVQLFAQHRT